MADCNACGFSKTPLTQGITICRRCDTSADLSKPGGMRAGPPNMPGTRNGWFNAPFGDKS